MNYSRQLGRLGRCILRSQESICPTYRLSLLCRSIAQGSLQKETRPIEYLGKDIFESLKTRVPVDKVPASTIYDVKLDDDKKTMQVKWSDGSSDLYPYIWLRDNCQCPKCYHTTSRQRYVLLEDLHISDSPTSLAIKDQGAKLFVRWNKGHKAYYPSEWLHERSFTEYKRKKRMEFIELSKTYWDSKMKKILSKIPFSDALLNDEAFLRVLQQLEKYGIVILQGAPLVRGQLRQLSDRIGFLRNTHYGEILTVKAKADHENASYTPGSLDLHVDYAYLESKPGIQIFHCIAQAKESGGETLFTDGFHTANLLKQSHPEKFDILTKIPVIFKDEGIKEDFREIFTFNQIPMISVNQKGSVTAVVSSQFSRDSFFNTPIEKVEEWYNAMLTFDKLLKSPDNMISYKMDEGDVVLVDNTRVLHGRRAYQVTQAQRERELETCYWDWDYARSCRRILQAKSSNQ